MLTQIVVLVPSAKKPTYQQLVERAVAVKKERKRQPPINDKKEQVV